MQRIPTPLFSITVIIMVFTFWETFKESTKYKFRDGF